MRADGEADSIKMFLQYADLFTVAKVRLGPSVSRVHSRVGVWTCQHVANDLVIWYVSEVLYKKVILVRVRTDELGAIVTRIDVMTIGLEFPFHLVLTFSEQLEFDDLFQSEASPFISIS